MSAYQLGLSLIQVDRTGCEKNRNSIGIWQVLVLVRVLCLSRPPNRVRNRLCNLRSFYYRRVESTRRYGSFANFLRRSVSAYIIEC